MPSIFEFVVATGIVATVVATLYAVLVISNDWPRFVDWCLGRDRRRKDDHDA